VAEIDRMLEANEDWARRFPGSKPVRPARAVAIVACMDSRMPLFGMLGLDVGDAHVIRNAGGVITEDTVRSLTISQHLLGTREIVLVHHTECGLQSTDDVSFADLVEQATGRRPPWAARAFTGSESDAVQECQGNGGHTSWYGQGQVDALAAVTNDRSNG